MSNYVKATNFATKDTLPTGDANKIVKGTELDNEFNSVAGAISSKADIASPSFTGTPAAPTATTGSNTTQLANTAYVKQEITAQGLGNMSTQAKSAVDITGGTITGVAISGGTITGTYGIDITGNAATATAADNGGVTSVNGQTGSVVFTDAFAIGSIMILQSTDNTNYTIGQTASGSILKHSCTGYSASSSGASWTTRSISSTSSSFPGGGTATTGTWRKMDSGLTYSSSVDEGVTTYAWRESLWVRVS